MKALVFGSSGFVGKNVCDALAAAGHEVVRANRDGASGAHAVDLADSTAVDGLLGSVRPEAIINCAGIIVNGDAANQNPVFTGNILRGIVNTGLQPKRVVVLGSAAEYGVVAAGDLPVGESLPLRPANVYGQSKVDEERTAMDFARQGLPVVVARVFNPIGDYAPEQQLIPRMAKQIATLHGRTDRGRIEISRLDSMRDYVDIGDVAEAIGVLITATDAQGAYNVGSGRSTSNGDILRWLIDEAGLEVKPEIIETFPEPEPLYACAADITRLKGLGWEPQHAPEEVVRRIAHDR